MFPEFLNAGDARRLSRSFERLSAYGFRGGALAGGLAVAAHLHLQGRATGQRPLHDADFVVETFASIPPSLAGGFLLHHIHPHAPEGKTLLQLIDREQALRIDLFRQFGGTLSRAGRLHTAVGPVTVISLEDVVARTTSLVLGDLRRGRTIDVKHARAFQRLSGLGAPARLDAAWHDHRQAEVESFHEAAQHAQRLLDQHPELVIEERYSADITLCPRCQDEGPFRRAAPELIVELLGYF